MTSPWLDIPLADYESHMALPQVAQAQLLANELESAVRAHRPRSVAVVGCAGGNGLDRLVGVAGRVVAIDINPAYVEATRRRFLTQIPGLEPHVADIVNGVPGCDPVDLLYVGLLLEYVDAGAALRALRPLCEPGGVVIVVSQVPDPGIQAVTPSPYASLQVLAHSMQLLDECAIEGYACRAGFTLALARRIRLPSGKAFVVQTYRS